MRRSELEDEGQEMARMTINRTRRMLYSLARFLGDYQAIKRAAPAD
jgi:hypothetical protein